MVLYSSSLCCMSVALSPNAPCGCVIEASAQRDKLYDLRECNLAGQSRT